MKDHDLRVYEVKPPNEKSQDDEKPKQIDSALLHHPFRLGIVAPSRSGKTNLLVNLLLRNDFYRKYFHYIYVWTPTFFDDDKWRLVELPEEQIFTEYNEADLQRVVNKQLEHTNKRALYIFDDCISEKGVFTNTYGTLLSKLVFRGRHWNISLCFVSQSYKAISRGFRVNMTGWIFFAIGNKQEIMKIAEENSGLMSKEEFLRIFKEATLEPYSFMYINYQEADPKKQYRKRFSEIMSVTFD